MKLYDFVCNNEKIVSALVRYGVVPCNINANVETYNKYLEHRKTCKRTQALENAAQDTKQSSRNVSYIVEKMEQEI